MKKFLVLVLALVLVFGLSVPALAFTSDDSEDVDHPYDLSIYLVEYDDNDLFGLVALPESDRGYAKNEIVAAVVELFVPKNEAIEFDEYGTLEFGGDNVDLDVTDNYVGGVLKLDTTSNVITDPLDPDQNISAPAWDDVDDKDAIIYTIINLEGKDTFKWLFFAKVTGDDASLYAKLVDSTGSNGFDPFEDEDEVLDLGGDIEAMTVALGGTVYSIYTGKDVYDPDGKDNAFLIFWEDDGDEYGIAIYTSDKYVSKGMSILLEDEDTGDLLYYDLGVNTNGELGVVDPDNHAKILTSGDLYDDVMDVYEDVVSDVFGMDYFLIGHYVRKSYFEDLVSADTIIATVDIEPWTAYVTVPDNIVVDPPKTGDAASIMGFVMVALSGAGAVALKKRS